MILVKNSALSIRQRLLNLAREQRENFDYVLKQYLIQRLLYRLSISEYQEQFLLKGAMLFWVWGGGMHRPTRDIDLLGFGSNDIDTLEHDFRQICSILLDDGLVFDLDSITGVTIKEDALYQGVRITGIAGLAAAKITFQVDIGFGDSVTPSAEIAILPSYLELPNPELRVYPVYTVIAEKFQTMVMLGVANSRIKDFYDLWTIAKEVEIVGSLMSDAITSTFEQRKTELSEQSLSIFETEFISDKNKQKQWRAFLSKNRLESDMEFNVLMTFLQGFLEPVYLAAAKGDVLHCLWSTQDLQWLKTK